MLPISNQPSPACEGMLSKDEIRNKLKIRNILAYSRFLVFSFFLVLIFSISVCAGQTEIDASIGEVQVPSSIDGSLQRCLFYASQKNNTPRPLLVSLHSWGANYNLYDTFGHALKQCQDRDWIFISPQFRGPNNNPEACASELAVQDILDAVEYAKENANVDDSRIYILGGSGGGFMSLVMANRVPFLWAGISCWVPLTDLAEWYGFCKLKGYKYARDIELSLGGAPGDPVRDKEYRKRSPIFWLENAKGVNIDIQTGIHDGQGGAAIPIDHSLKAFNVLAKANGYEEKMLTEKEIEFMTSRAKVPSHLANEREDEVGRKYEILFRRSAGNVRLTLFNAAHNFDSGKGTEDSPAFDWLGKQVKKTSIEYSLNGDWDFTFTSTSSMNVPPVPTDDAFDTRIKVPGQWDDQIENLKNSKWFADAEFRKITSSGFAAGSRVGDIKYLYGNGWHRKNFYASSDWKDRNIKLTIGRTMGKIHLLLNRKHLGSFDYGNYVPYEIDITEYLNFEKENELLISVDNTKGFEVGYASMEPHGRAGGIGGGVSVRVSAGSGEIVDTYIRPGKSLKEVVWEVELESLEKNKNITGSKILWEVRDSENAGVLAQGQVDVDDFVSDRKIQWSARIEKILPWSDRQPNLYWTNLKWLQSDGTLLDTHSQRFGLRRLSYKGRKFFLNDKPCYLRGEFVGGYYPVHCAVPTSKEYWLMRFKKAKEIGMNYLNFANQVCPVEMMEAADEVGMILQCGDSATALNRKSYQGRYKEVWEPIVRLTRKYPSMGIYGFNGELNYYEGIIEQFQKLYDLIKSLHPESMVMPQQAIRGIDYSFDEKGKKELTLEPFPHHAERLAQYTKACDFFGHYSGGALSYSHDKRPLWHEMDKRFAIYTRPISAHELFMGASYLNPDNAVKYTGRIPPTLYDILEQDLSSAGMLGKWAMYYNNASRLQGICKKYNVEKVRKCHELVAYEFLGMRDQHFVPHYTTGILDEFFGVKPGDTIQKINNYIGESVLLLDYDGGESINRAFYGQTPFTGDIMVSLFGEEPLAEGELSWTLKAGNKTLWRSRCSISNIANGSVSTIETLDIFWPKVKKTTKLNLSVRLTGGGYDITNDWDFWIFAKSKSPVVRAAADEKNLKLLKGRYKTIKPLNGSSDQKLLIVSDMGDREIEHIEKGGDILLLETKVFPLHTGFVNFRSGLGGRSHHNVGKVISMHPIFENLPHEGWGNWHFYYMFDGANNISFDGLEKDYGVSFDPIVEVISSAADVRKQALIFEKKVGRGRLFVSNCIYKEDNAASVALMDGIIDYIQSRDFNPATAMSMDILKELAEPALPVEPGNLLKNASFEERHHLRMNWLQNPVPNEFEIDDTQSHGGKRSLKFELGSDDLNSGKIQVGVRTGLIEFDNWRKVPAGRVRFGAWCKVGNVSDEKGDRKIFCIAKVRYERGDYHNIPLDFDTGKAGWQYLETTWEPDRTIYAYNIVMGLKDGSGTVWFDDVYFGHPRQRATLGSDQFPSGTTWSNKPVTVGFGSDKWYSINKGQWLRGDKVEITKAGISVIEFKENKGDWQSEIRNVGIDVTLPVIELVTNPAIDQEAGVYSASVDTVFAIKIVEDMAPTESIEISLDGKDFVAYSEPFKLPKGRHEIRCRVSDAAGNRSNVLSGEYLSGGETTKVMVDVKE